MFVNLSPFVIRLENKISNMYVNRIVKDFFLLKFPHSFSPFPISSHNSLSHASAIKLLISRNQCLKNSCGTWVHYNSFEDGLQLRKLTMSHNAHNTS